MLQTMDEKIIEVVQYKLEEASEEVEKFKRALDDENVHAVMKGSDRFFKAAAMKSACEMVLAEYNGGANLTEIKQTLNRNVREGARSIFLYQTNVSPNNIFETQFVVAQMELGELFEHMERLHEAQQRVNEIR
jgi:hypothetical protein